MRLNAPALSLIASALLLIDGRVLTFGQRKQRPVGSTTR